MNILIFTPVWKRPEIFKLYLENKDFVRKQAAERLLSLKILCIISKDDPCFRTNKRLAEKHNVDICYFENKTLGWKKNQGLRYALKNYQFDYLLEMNSDSLMNPELFDYYRLFMKENFSFFGITSFYILNWYNKHCLFIHNYNEGSTIGPGRMYNRSILTHPDPWPDQNDCMDTFCTDFFKKRGIKEHVIDNRDAPYILDVKTNTNIWHWEHISGMAQKQIDYKKIMPLFGVNVYQDDILQYQDYRGFRKLYNEFLSMGFSKSQSYEEAERNYELYYGKRKFKDYESFRVTRYKGQHNNPL